MRNKLIKNISVESCEKLLSYCMEKDMEIFQVSGNLQDNFLINNTDLTVSIGKNKPRKYIIIKEVYLNSWSSELNLLLTDDDKERDMLVEKWEEQFDDEEN